MKTQLASIWIAYVLVTTIATAGSHAATTSGNCFTPDAPANGGVKCDFISHSQAEYLCLFTCKSGYVFDGIPDATLSALCYNGTGFVGDIKTPPCVAMDDAVALSSTEIPVFQPSCVTWGTNHYRTFDSKVYTFDGQCTYMLAFQPDTFDIMVVNGHNCDDKGPCKRGLDIYFEDASIQLRGSNVGPKVIWNGQDLKVPGSKGGTTFEKIGKYLMVKSSLGFTIKWDGDKFITIQVSDGLRGKLAGLCGRFNGNPADDFEDVDGKLMTSPVSFASSWKKTDLSEDEATCEESAVETSCTDEEAKDKADNNCRDILDDQAFQFCHAAIDPRPYFDSCQKDCCGSNKTECTCDTLSAYSHACTNLGIEMNWRQAGRCEITCSNGMVYKECGSSCLPDCKNANAGCSDSTCFDGCFCPDGQVLHNGKCIQKSYCPCEHDGLEYQDSEAFEQDCNTCTCKSGKWLCTKNTCGATCSAIGSSHFVTFDGSRYNFEGACSYYLMKGPSIKIILDMRCSQGEHACTKSVIVNYGVQSVTLDPNHQLFVNGKELMDLPHKGSGFSVSMVSSLLMEMKLSNGIVIMWDGKNRIDVKAPPSFKDRTKGLCGTYDEKQSNDFLIPSGIWETTPSEFGKQWNTKTKKSCSDSQGIMPTCSCNHEVQKKEEAKKHCQVLKDKVFEACHNTEAVDEYYKNCMCDMCSCRVNIKECFCSSLGHYADVCASKGVKIQWRNEIEECHIKCPPGQVYQVCGRPCERTCRNMAENKDPLCNQECVEGCNCPNGQSLNDNGECIPVEECPCVFDGREFPAGYVTLMGIHLCTCKGANWKCERISIESPIHAVQPLCPDAMEYSKCASSCPATCKNFEDAQTCEKMDCEPGCVCQEGYVLDGGKCIEQRNCPCHYGGQSYYEGESIDMDCNKCTCTNQRWQCENKICPATCSAYGNSHFTTFDGRQYQFQGTCNYILAQSTDPAMKFTVTVKNIECGTSGVACSKGIDFILGEEGTDSFHSLKIVRGKRVVQDPSSSFKVEEIGEMLYISTPIGLTLEWDKGTRIYLKANTHFMNKVEGLCGNFNGDRKDDFTVPQGGPPVVKATSFGDSWKVHSYCADSEDIIDSCDIAPHRRAWAQLKCSLLASEIFEPCHAVVPYQDFMERCEFDACACDQGGDCECLCTAIAAYAHECASHGIVVKWRTKDTCGLECSDCKEYNPCMSRCPKRTCDNRLLVNECQEVQNTCFEGCDLHPCPEGQVYDSLVEPVVCIPEPLCDSPSCIVKDKKYREGERIDDPSVCRLECEICNCRNGTVNHITFGNCEPMVTTPTAPPPVTPILPNTTPKPSVKCITSEWTSWMSNSVPTHLNSGDRETKEDLRKKYSFCSNDQITDIRCRVINQPGYGIYFGQHVNCSLDSGFTCQHKDQPGGFCLDFEVSFYCKCEPIKPTISTSTHLYSTTFESTSETSSSTKSTVSTTEVPVSSPKPATPSCGWTKWMNSYTPDVDGDIESLSNLRMVYSFCENPVDIMCRTTPSIDHPDGIAFNHAGQLAVACNLNNGLVCIHNMQKTGQQCFDYEVTVLCEDGCTSVSVTPTRYTGTPVTVTPTRYTGTPVTLTPGTTVTVTTDSIQTTGPYETTSTTPVTPTRYTGTPVTFTQTTPKTLTPGTTVTVTTDSTQTTGSYETTSTTPVTPTRYTGTPVTVTPTRYTGTPVTFTQTTPKTLTPGTTVTVTTDSTQTTGPYETTSTRPDLREECKLTVGLYDADTILEKQFHASSSVSAAFDAHNGRFYNYIEGPTNGGAWMPKPTDPNPEITIDLERIMIISGIMTQGRPEVGQWVTKYTVSVSEDGTSFKPYTEDGSTEPKVFTGNTDNENPSVGVFKRPLSIRKISIHPKEYVGAIAMRIELFTCEDYTPSTMKPGTTGPYDSSTLSTKTTGPYDSSTPSTNITGPYDSSTHSSTLTSGTTGPYDSSTPSTKTTERYDNSTPSTKTTSPYDSSTLSTKTTGPYDSSTTSTKTTGPYDSSTPSTKTTGPYDSSTPSTKTTGPYDSSTPSTKTTGPYDSTTHSSTLTSGTTGPYDSSTPSTKTTGPYDSSTHSSTLTSGTTGPYDSSTPSTKTTGPYDSSTLSTKTTGPYDSSTLSTKTTGPYVSSTQSTKTTGPYDSSTPSTKTTGPYDSSTQSTKTTGPYVSSTQSTKTTGPYDSSTPSKKTTGPFDTQTPTAVTHGPCTKSFWLPYVNKTLPERDGGDREFLTETELKEICVDGTITDIACYAPKGKEYLATGDVVECNVENGLTCSNKENGDVCQDYKIRYYCECDPRQTSSTSSPLPSTSRRIVTGTSTSPHGDKSTTSFPSTTTTTGKTTTPSTASTSPVTEIKDVTDENHTTPTAPTSPVTDKSTTSFPSTTTTTGKTTTPSTASTSPVTEIKDVTDENPTTPTAPTSPVTDKSTTSFPSTTTTTGKTTTPSTASTSPVTEIKDVTDENHTTPTAPTSPVTDKSTTSFPSTTTTTGKTTTPSTASTSPVTEIKDVTDENPTTPTAPTSPVTDKSTTSFPSTTTTTGKTTTPSTASTSPVTEIKDVTDENHTTPTAPTSPVTDKSTTSFPSTTTTTGKTTTPSTASTSPVTEIKDVTDENHTTPTAPTSPVTVKNLTDETPTIPTRTPSPPTASTTQHPPTTGPTRMKVRCKWSQWLNTDTPQDDGDDMETITSLKTKFGICPKITNIECREAGSSTNALQIGVQCDPFNGLRCYKRDMQGGKCHDYEVRVLCWSDMCKETTPITPTPSITTLRKSTTISPFLGSTVSGTTTKVCPRDQEWHHCAYRCHEVCESRQRGACQGDDPNDCIPGCRGNKKCSPGELINHAGVCVAKEVCTCIKPDGTIAKPTETWPDPDEPCSMCSCFSNEKMCGIYITGCATPPSMSTPVPPPVSTKKPPTCGWTEWINNDKPDTGPGDMELLTNMPDICAGADPLKVECREAVNQKEFVGVKQKRVICNHYLGLACYNNFKGTCVDYEIRLFCPCISPPPSTSSTRISPTATPTADTNSTATPTADPTATPATIAATTTYITRKPQICSWTNWTSVHEPSQDGEQEYFVQIRGKYDFCNSEAIIDIECRDKATKETAAEQGLKARCDVNFGFICFNKEQTNKICSDYEIRVFCDPIGSGCSRVSSTAVPSTSTVTTVKTSETTIGPICDTDLGLKNGKIRDYMISVSSQRDFDHSFKAVRLDDSHGWMPSVNDINQFIQIDFGINTVIVTGIIVQGSPTNSASVKSYKIVFSSDGQMWTPISEHSGKVKIFNVEWKNNVGTREYFKKPIRTRLIRVIPLTWRGPIIMRMELIGCGTVYPTVIPSLPPTVKTITPRTGTTIKVTPYLPKNCVDFKHWVDLHQPNPTDPDDYEPIETIVAATPNCTIPMSIECRTTTPDHLPYIETGQIVSCNLWQGLKCDAEMSPQKLCYNYEVRIGCLRQTPDCSIVTPPTQPTITQLCYPDLDATHCPKEGCAPGYFCNGTRCVHRSDCACVLDGKVIRPGGITIDQDCEVCQCLNGEVICMPKTCPSSLCKEGQSSLNGDTCECECRVCETGEFQCADGPCIPLDRQCDSFQDCADDELNCVSTTMIPSITPRLPNITTQIPSRTPGTISTIIPTLKTKLPTPKITPVIPTETPPFITTLFPRTSSPTPDVCANVKCPEAKFPTLKPGMTVRLVKTNNGCCYEYEVCDQSKCNSSSSKEECVAPYTRQIISTDDCCQEYKCACPRQCPKPVITECENGYTLTSIPQACNCSVFGCVPVTSPTECYYTSKYEVTLGGIVETTKPVALAYKPGEYWQDGLCKECTCYNETNFLAVSCQEDLCTPCSVGFRKIEVPGSCCGKCEPYGCIVGGKVYKDGEKINSTEQCFTNTCEKDPILTEFIIVERPVKCTPLEELPPCMDDKDAGQIDESGCCRKCNAMISNTTECTPCEALPVFGHPKFSIGHLSTTLPSGITCKNVNPLPNLKKCIGYCLSSSVLQQMMNKENRCRSCQVAKTHQIDVKMSCSDGSQTVKSFDIPEKCGCSDCDSDISNGGVRK